MHTDIMHQRVNLKLGAMARTSSDELIKNINNSSDKKVKGCPRSLS